MKTSELKALIKECVREVFAEQLQLALTPVRQQPIKEIKTIDLTTSNIPVGPTVDYRELLRQQFETSNAHFNEDNSSNNFQPQQQWQPPVRTRPVPPSLQGNPFLDFITMEAPRETI